MSESREQSDRKRGVYGIEQLFLTGSYVHLMKEANASLTSLSGALDIATVS